MWKFRHTTDHGAMEGKTQQKVVLYYNLRAITAVGYRVNSHRATEFRKWATEVLHEYIIKGFAMDDERLNQMNADEFRDYCLGFIFYKYLSKSLHQHANDVLKEDKMEFLDVKEKSRQGKEILSAIEEESVDKLGYFLIQSQLFSTIAKRTEDPEQFILDDHSQVLSAIERSTMGTGSENDFDHLFEDLDLNSTKLGRTEKDKNQLISKIIVYLNKIDFGIQDSGSDILGDAYEYLIG